MARIAGIVELRHVRPRVGDSEPYARTLQQAADFVLVAVHVDQGKVCRQSGGDSNIEERVGGMLSLFAREGLRRRHRAVGSSNGTSPDRGGPWYGNDGISAVLFCGIRRRNSGVVLLRLGESAADRSLTIYCHNRLMRDPTGRSGK